jgi:4-amino-4-deoxy-L-arabinose transferase-like glycosyltransferase
MPENARPEAAGAGPAPVDRQTLWIGLSLVVAATAIRLAWVLLVPTVPTSDFAMYRESANHLSELGWLDHGFIYMPGYVLLLAAVQRAGGDLLAQKLIGVAFGGLGAAGLYGIGVGFFKNRRVAALATFVYALWPAGVAVSSVVGTDMPAAASIAAALGALGVLGPRRPRAAAVAFGALMGLAAWMRAVALPLSALSLGYWLAARAGLRAALARTAVAVAMTLVVLAPWGAYHVHRTGRLYFTDDHGGVTAIVGANPNSEGTYTRALNRMFAELTGRSILDEPHDETDRLAFALAKDWTRFEPAFALGLATKRLERFFDQERRLLYWSVFRPGVLVGREGAWFAARAERIGAGVDRFGLAVALLAVTGVVAAAARGRWLAVSLVPFSLALTATYTLFFAEPRYRLPVELLAFPFAALVVHDVALVGYGLARGRRSRAFQHVWLRGPAIAFGVVATLLGSLAWGALDDVGARLRDRHRWAATVWRADGAARLAKWRPADLHAPRSPVEGLADGARLASSGASPTAIVVDLGAAPLPAGDYALSLGGAASGALHVRVAPAGGHTLVDGDADATAPVALRASFTHGGGPLVLWVTLTSPGVATLTVNDLRIDRVSVTDPPRPGS